MQNNSLHNRLAELEQKWLNGSITPEEAKEYMDWYNQENSENVHIPEILAQDELTHQERLFSLIQSKMHQNDAIEDRKDKKSVIRLVHPNFLRYAAAIILIFGISAYLWNLKQPSDRALVQLNRQNNKNAIIPGKDVATITLADGTEILLDSMSNGVVAKEGNIQIIKLAEGEIVYGLKEGGKENVVINTMTTPGGGKYQLLLPDGSRIWLNSASSVRYPTFFKDNERKIYVSGEVYIDVAKNKSKPFIVDVNGKSSIEVLGTGFNVNSYDDEGDIKITLLEGSLRVNQNNKSFLLSPGQQLDGVKLNDDPNIEQVVAWKNGYLNFDNSDIQTALRKIARWYNIEVVYVGNAPKDILMGKIPMNADIEQVLKILKNIGIQFRIEGKKIIVTS